MKIKYKKPIPRMLTRWSYVNKKGFYCKPEDAKQVFGIVVENGIFRSFQIKPKNKSFIYQNELHMLDNKPFESYALWYKNHVEGI